MAKTGLKSLKKYIGVCVRESTEKKWKDRPDRCYWIVYRKSKKTNPTRERCGWASEGWTPEKAQRRRYQILEEIRTGAYKSKEERMQEALTFGELFEKFYLPWAKENKMRSRDDFYMYRKWLKRSLGKKSLSGISPLDLERLKKSMRKAGKSDSTTKHALCLVRQMYNKSIAWGLYQGENPCKGVKFPCPNNARQRFLSPDESDLLLKALHEQNTQLCDMATISLYAGLRLSEVFGLTWGAIDLENGIINIQDTKNKEPRPIFITNPIETVLNELTPGSPDEPLFKSKYGKPVVWLSKEFKHTVDNLGMNEGIKDPRQRVSFHTLRHSFASWAVMAGVPLYLVGQALGHKTLTMTARYSHLSPESQRQAFEAVAKAQKEAHKVVPLLRADRKVG